MSPYCLSRTLHKRCFLFLGCTTNQTRQQEFATNFFFLHAIVCLSHSCTSKHGAYFWKKNAASGGRAQTTKEKIVPRLRFTGGANLVYGFGMQQLYILFISIRNKLRISAISCMIHPLALRVFPLAITYYFLMGWCVLSGNLGHLIQDIIASQTSMYRHL